MGKSLGELHQLFFQRPDYKEEWIDKYNAGRWLDSGDREILTALANREELESRGEPVSQLFNNKFRIFPELKRIYEQDLLSATIPDEDFDKFKSVWLSNRTISKL